MAKEKARVWRKLYRADEYLVVSTTGNIIQAPKKQHGCAQMGVCVVSEDQESILLCVDEVSDEEVLNAFLYVPAGSEVITSMQMTDAPEDENYTGSATHEIIMDVPGSFGEPK
jgi:hypothetical protein